MKQAPATQLPRLIILDRDGVINYDSPDFIKSPEEWIPIPGSLEAIAVLNKAGILVAVASNQSGIGRGLFNLQMFGRIQQKMKEQLAAVGGHIDFFVYCPHHPDETCTCRKPKPGLLYQISEYFQINLEDPRQAAIPTIGDSLRDLQAAQAANTTPILVLTGNGKKTRDQLPPELQNIAVYDNLETALKALIATDKYYPEIA